jgi:hypothetical protein
MALVGFVDEVSRVRIAGWAMDTDNPDRATEVNIDLNGNLRASLPANLSRLDVSESMKTTVLPELHGSMTGLYGFEFSFDPALSVFDEIDVEVRFNDTGALLHSGARRLGVPRSRSLSPRPLLLTSYGRAGTTILMQYLSRHPSIIVAERYPFEINLVSYYSRALQVLVSCGDRERSSNPETIDRDPYFIGSNYFNRPEFFSLTRNNSSALEEFFEQVVPQQYVGVFGRMLEEFYTRLGIDQNKADAKFFAEKCSPVETVRDGARLLCGGARELLLIRDPRDIVCSAKSVWGNTTASWISDVAGWMHRLEEIHDANSFDTMLIRYEDLVTEPNATMVGIYRFLGLDEQVVYADPLEDTTLFSRHGTSRTPAESIGRWKRELSLQEISICNDAFAGFLARFGYPTGECQE